MCFFLLGTLTSGRITSMSLNWEASLLRPSSGCQQRSTNVSSLISKIFCAWKLLIPLLRFQTDRTFSFKLFILHLLMKYRCLVSWDSSCCRKLTRNSHHLLRHWFLLKLFPLAVSAIYNFFLVNGCWDLRSPSYYNVPCFDCFWTSKMEIGVLRHTNTKLVL